MPAEQPQTPAAPEPAGRLDAADRWLRQGLERLAAGDSGAAIEALEQAAALAPSSPNVHFSLARAHLQADARDRTEAALKLTLQADPRHAGALHMLGALYCEMDRFPEALPLLISAGALEPDNAQFQRDLGAILLFFGDLPAARETLLRAVEINPHVPEIIDTLTRLVDADDGSTDYARLIAVLEGLAARGDEVPQASRLELHFARAKVWEDRGEADRAFADLAAGNALKRPTVSFDIEAAEERLATIAEAFDRGVIERLAGAGSNSQRPIFIVGMPRSGSTLVEQIICAHSQVHGAGETPTMAKVAEGTRGMGGEIFPHWAACLTPVDCTTMASIYLERTPPPLPGQIRVTDKWLENFEHLGLIHLLLPQATIIHCRRDPRDLGYSCFALRFTDGQDYAYDLVELGRYWRAYDRLMDHWRAVLPPGRILEVPYEAVVDDVDGWSRRIIDHCGLAWEDASLSFYDSKRPVRSASAAQVRKPIYRRSVGRWKPFARHLEPMFEAMGRPWDANRPPTAS